MRIVITLLSLLLTLLALYSCSKSPNDLQIIYSGNMDGELEPCGCTPLGNMGGIKRRLTVLRDLRQSAPQSVAISAGGLLSQQMSSDEIKNRFILSGFKQLDYDAIGVQWQDLTHGPKLLMDSGLPFIASNWQDHGFERAKLIRREGGTLAFFQWLDENTSPYRGMKGADRLIFTETVTLERSLAAAKYRQATTLLATTLTLDEALRTMPLKQVDILIIKANYEEYAEPKQVQGILVLQPGSRGMRLGNLKLKIDSTGGITSWSHEILPMPQSIPDAADMKDWYDDYNQAVKEDYQRRVAIRKSQQRGESPFTGTETCGTCHIANYNTWRESKHAKAFQDLVNVKKHFDPDCLNCHTLGLNTEGGYLDQYLTPHMKNVQCESCHGAGREHAESGGVKKTHALPESRADLCIRCHNRAHSPQFSYEQYWPKIQHLRDY